MKNSHEPLQNRLVWSSHRARILSTCPRRYYHNHIGSWEGWLVTSSPESQCAYRLKNLTTPELEIGQLIHNQIRLIFLKARDGWAINVADEIGFAQLQFREFVAASRIRRLEELTAKRKKLLLHENGKDITPAAMAQYEEWIALLLERFFSLSDMQRLIATPADLLFDFLDNAVGFEISHELGAPARPRTDAVFREGELFVVADFKSGLPSGEHRRQGLIYALYITKCLNLPPTQKVEVRFYYLASGRVESHQYNDEERSEALWQIGEDFALMQSLSDDAVINCGPESRFRASVSRSCFGCNFRGMCEPFLQSKLASASFKASPVSLDPLSAPEDTDEI